MDVIAQEAETALLHGDYEAALETLEGIQFSLCNAPCRRKILQLKALARVHMVETSCLSWWQAFELDPPPTSSSNDVKRAFKRLAALIHPDKCETPDAGTAFAALQGGLELLLNEIESGGGSASPHAKRSKQTDKDGQREFNWWDGWEEEDTEFLPNRESDEAGQKDARQLADTMSVEELDAEVRRRQALLSTRSDGKERPDLHALRDALSRARQALSAKLNSNRTNVTVEGGFLHQPNF